MPETRWHFEIREDDKRLRIVVFDDEGNEAPAWIWDQVVADVRERLRRRDS